jgi:hypothetical protein
MRRDLSPARPSDALTAELTLLVTRRGGLAEDRNLWGSITRCGLDRLPGWDHR